MTVDSANIKQISFITNQMHGYDENELIDIMAIKDESYFYNAFLMKAKRIFLDPKKF